MKSDSFPENWPKVQFQKRINQRNLRISVKESGIRVSGPASIHHSELVRFLFEKKDWIERVLNRVKERQILRPTEADDYFVFIDGRWISVTLVSDASNQIVWDGKDTLIAKLRIRTENVSLPALKEAIYKYLAYTVLTKEFNEFTTKRNIEYARLFIRSQKTKWGTCSAQRNISFNYRLIKCPFPIRFYLYAHEAAHLFQQNHSPAFWKVVASFDPDYKKHIKWLKENERFLFEVD